MQRSILTPSLVPGIADVRALAVGSAYFTCEHHDRFFSSHPFALSKSTVVDDILGDPTLQSFFALR